MRLPAAAIAPALALAAAAPAAPPGPAFNRAPLADKPYAELPLGAVNPEGWLRDELERMARGMTGHLDEWYPEVCGPRNAWLGGDGDTWERGPYWIDGLYPLAALLGDEILTEKALRWIEWTLANQRENGQIGPYETKDEDRTQPPPPGAQIHKPDDWWPRMVMLKILQQHYMATGDQRVIACLQNYFRYQLQELPGRPLHDPANPASGSWWAAQRGGDNLLVVLWLYNVTGDAFLPELANLLHAQTVPVTEWFSHTPENRVRRRADQPGHALHCVNLAQMMKTPVVRWQQDKDDRHLEAVETALTDIRAFHGQTHGLYGGDEGMHGDTPSRGSELCSAVEMMFSLEKMLEITGNPAHADRLERIAFNALPTQCTDDHRARQYFQQANQVVVSQGDRDFFEDGGERQVYGLLNGYPCCTCNLHQGWPKFAQHLWFATKDGGLAALVYAPSSVTASVAGGTEVNLRQGGGYPFQDTVTIDVSTPTEVAFPLHLRVPGWCKDAALSVNDEPVDAEPDAGTIHVLDRRWKDGDRVTLHLPMPTRASSWYHRSVALERGPLVFALDVEADEKEVVRERPPGVPGSAMHRGFIEYHPRSPWNFALPETVARNPHQHVRVAHKPAIPENPWTGASAPVEMFVPAHRLPGWGIERNSAADPPLSPVDPPEGEMLEEIRLVPYGATTLRVSAFPVSSGGPQIFRRDGVTTTASHCYSGDTLAALNDGTLPANSADSRIPRHTFWPRQGSAEWLQYTFDQPRELQTVRVYWYDDTGAGACRPPASWRLLYREGTGWKPVEPSGEFGTAVDRFNEVTFKPVTTDALRIDAQLRDDLTAGVLEWEVE